MMHVCMVVNIQKKVILAWNQGAFRFSNCPADPLVRVVPDLCQVVLYFSKNGYFFG